MTIELTTQEHETIRTGAFGAIMLVSRADPGFFALFRETMAGSKALAAAPAELRDLLRSGGLVTPPGGDGEQIEGQVLDSLTEAVQILSAKAPEQVGPFREVVVAACDQAARASADVVPAEAAVIERVRAALGV